MAAEPPGSEVPADGDVPVDESPGGGSADDRALVARLRAGDAEAFAMLVDGWTPGMLRVARMHVATDAIAEEVVQDTWLAALRGLDRFEGRSSLRTWVYRILVNRAKTRGVREKRQVPFASLVDAETGEGFSAVDATRFAGPGQPWAGHWAAPPPRWDEQPEQRLESKETMAAIRRAIADLPPVQRAVITLRDIEGWDAAEVVDALELTEGNQRVLLHRARSKVRQALEKELSA